MREPKVNGNSDSTGIERLEGLKRRYDILKWVAGIVIGLAVGAFTVGLYYRSALTFINDKSVPPGMIAFFAGATCPGHWARADELRGRYVVGGDPNHLEDIGKAVGTALESSEDRPTGAHTHVTTNTQPVANAGRDRMMGGGNGGFIDPGFKSDGGADLAGKPLKAGTNAPYIILTACRSPT